MRWMLDLRPTDPDWFIGFMFFAGVILGFFMGWKARGK